MGQCGNRIASLRCSSSTTPALPRRNRWLTLSFGSALNREATLTDNAKKDFEDASLMGKVLDGEVRPEPANLGQQLQHLC